MTTEIIPLMFDNELIRMAADESKSALIAADICRAIGIRNTAQALEPLDEDEKGICITYTLGGPQELLTVTEGGAYTLVLRSRAAMTPGTRAYAFRKWLTAEALPALRRTGRYAMPGLDTRRPVSLNRMTALWDRVAKSTDPAERVRLFNDFPPTIYVLAERPSIPPGDKIELLGPRSAWKRGKVDYAWYVWDLQAPRLADARVIWIPPRERVLAA